MVYSQNYDCPKIAQNYDIGDTFDDKKDDKCWADHHVVATNDTLWFHNWRFEEFHLHHIHSWRKLYEVKTYNKYYNCGPSAKLFKYYLNFVKPLLKNLNNN